MELPEGYSIETGAQLQGEAPVYFVTFNGFQLGTPNDRSGAGTQTFETEREAGEFIAFHYLSRHNS